ncbi:hypothetical protein H2198_001290 [Neophaeococcomyces mojaviensis]|uniref:Uncharacterized protein n=1 Tax=Neophaeococcomyces mojaviensis TaxID=3383035 RepID=A0ACC3AHH6_9EURO|nr:hypothetical protein H2198_001290 [Knufia sp. JES_112]
MSKEPKERLGSAEKARLRKWARANEADVRSKALTLPLSIDYKGTLLKNDTFRLDQQGCFDDAGTTWLNLQVQMKDATLVTIYIQWDGYAKAYISRANVLWAVKRSVTKEWEHHTVYVGYKEVGYEQTRKGWKMRVSLSMITKQCRPRDLAAKQICTGSDLKDISRNPVPSYKDASKNSEK